MKFYCIIPLPSTFFTAFLLALFGFQNLSAQNTATSSPYSRFALGRPENTGFSEVTALGGSYTGFRNDTIEKSTFFINQGNPSSYAFNKFTIYEFGARYGYYTFSGKDADVKKQSGGFNYIAISFPVRKKMGAALGHVPFSSVGYEVTTTTENVDSIGTIKNNYRGNGGINQVFGGLAYRPFEARYRKLFRTAEYKLLDSLGNTDAMRRKKFFANMLSNFSIGSNVSFLYGTLNYATRKYFPASFGAVFNTNDYTETQLADVYFQAGAQISFDINTVKRKLTKEEKLLPDSVKKNLTARRDLQKKWKFTLGYSASLPKNVMAKGSHVAYNFTLASFDREIPFDTFSYNPSFKGTVNLPFMQSIGIGIKKGNSLTILLDAGYQQWSKFTFLGNNQGLKDQIRLSGGLQWQPNREAVGAGAYFKRSFYRIGGRYNTGYLFLKGNHINEYAVSGGIGLPVGKRIFTVVNLTAEYGMAGTTQNQLIQEKFLRFVIGLTFNDRWFIKPKYD